MHQEIRQHLEDYLRGDDHRIALPAEFQAHLGECAECARELQSLEAHARLLRSLAASAPPEPRAGFYARVMEQIEGRLEAQRASLWAPFLDRKFGFRLAVGSAALVALLATYLITSEPAGPEFATAPAVVLSDASRAADVSAQQNEVLQQRQRDAVLVDLASYRQ
jgi:anti-sigma factor RsiW